MRATRWDKDRRLWRPEEGAPAKRASELLVVISTKRRQKRHCHQPRKREEETAVQTGPMRATRWDKDRRLWRPEEGAPAKRASELLVVISTKRRQKRHCHQPRKREEETAVQTGPVRRPSSAG
ncbi:hypothetical protein ACLB2K_037894 [Fragaria x ananassa]